MKTKWRFKTEEEFKKEERWGDVCPSGWNKFEQMNKYLGQIIPDKYSEFCESGRYFNMDGWSFDSRDYVQIKEWRFKTKEEFIKDGKWESGGYPNNWNSLRKMNHYLGTLIPEEFHKYCENKYNFSMYDYKEDSCWNFLSTDYTFESLPFSESASLYTEFPQSGKCKTKSVELEQYLIKTRGPSPFKTTRSQGQGMAWDEKGWWWVMAISRSQKPLVELKDLTKFFTEESKESKKEEKEMTDQEKCKCPYTEGERISCKIEGDFISDAKIHYENGNIYICQNSKCGTNCVDKLGYNSSWIICGDYSGYKTWERGCESNGVSEVKSLEKQEELSWAKSKTKLDDIKSLSELKDKMDECSMKAPLVGKTKFPDKVIDTTKSNLLLISSKRRK